MAIDILMWGSVHQQPRYGPCNPVCPSFSNRRFKLSSGTTDTIRFLSVFFFCFCLSRVFALYIPPCIYSNTNIYTITYILNMEEDITIYSEPTFRPHANIRKLFILRWNLRCLFYVGINSVIHWHWDFVVNRHFSKSLNVLIETKFQPASLAVLT